MTTHFTIPIRRSPCGGTRYQAMPADLSSYLTADEYSASMSRIQAANKASLGARFLYTMTWMGYVVGIMQVCGLFQGYDQDGYTYDNYYINTTWVGLGVAIVSFIGLIGVGRWMRKQRAANVAAAVQVEHITYSTHSPQLAWRVVDEGHLEINVLNHNQQHIAALEHQVHILQAQVAAQAHHQAVDHELIAHQAAAAHHAHAAHFAPPAPVLSPSHHHVQYYPTVGAAAPVAEPVYAHAVYQPQPGSVFAHPPPQYYAPRAELRAPLVQHQY